MRRDGGWQLLNGEASDSDEDLDDENDTLMLSKSPNRLVLALLPNTFNVPLADVVAVMGMACASAKKAAQNAASARFVDRMSSLLIHSKLFRLPNKSESAIHSRQVGEKISI